MSLVNTISTDLKKAMKERNSETLAVLRMLKSAMSNLAIEKKVPELDDASTIQLIRKQIKTRQESAEAFTKGNRPELAAQEVREVAVLENYLPKPLSDAEVQELVLDAIKASGASSKKEMGKVMKLATERAAGRVDGKTLSTLISQHLTS